LGDPVAENNSSLEVKIESTQSVVHKTVKFFWIYVPSIMFEV